VTSVMPESGRTAPPPHPAGGDARAMALVQACPAPAAEVTARPTPTGAAPAAPAVPGSAVAKGAATVCLLAFDQRVMLRALAAS
jgi:hypothetical protein